MPNTYRASAYNGHINLEQQRKRAKELLTRLRDGTASAQTSLLARQKAFSGTPLLADAQWLIARELGFTSWTQLKAHIDAVEFAARHPHSASDEEASTQHWRCGNDIAHSLRLAGFQGIFHMFWDPLCMGPVTDTSEPELIEMRSQFISSSFNMRIEEARHRLQDEYQDLARMRQAQHAVLWCDADAYDQLFLIAALARLKTPPDALELIEIGHVPGVERFIGIGQLAPEVLAWLWPQRRRLDAAALVIARKAWKAYCAASPQGWAEIALSETSELPFLAPALRRQLQELPSLRDGLSMSERLILQIISELGRPTAAQVFNELNSLREPLPFLGDGMFGAMARNLIDVPQPLIREFQGELSWYLRPIELTELGRRVLAGDAYWIDHASKERWVGGVRIKPGKPHWALDDRLVPRQRL